MPRIGSSCTDPPNQIQPLIGMSARSCAAGGLVPLPPGQRHDSAVVQSSERSSPTLTLAGEGAVETVGCDTVGDPALDSSRRGTGGLASRLIFKAVKELLAERQPGKPIDDRRAEISWPPVRGTSSDVETGGDLKQVSLRIQVHVHLDPHVSNNDFCRPHAPLDWPPSARAEDPGNVTACLFEGNRMAVELLHQADVMQHRRHVKQLRIEVDAMPHAVPGSPQIGAKTVVHQG